ncbi:MAG: hypothetical protein QNJ47_11225 [Nostocaceae cyanobacterium]|nr:hypothetical protein [Nostocaceae cyanobacterium]
MTSCGQILTEIANLRADIAKLDDKFILKEEKSNIIQSSVSASEKTIVPQIPSIATTVAATVVSQKRFLRT